MLPTSTALSSQLYETLTTIGVGNLSNYSRKANLTIGTFPVPEDYKPLPPGFGPTGLFFRYQQQLMTGMANVPASPPDVRDWMPFGYWMRQKSNADVMLELLLYAGGLIGQCAAPFNGAFERGLEASIEALTRTVEHTMLKRSTTTVWGNFTGKDVSGNPYVPVHEVLGRDAEALIFYDGCVEPVLRHALEVVVASSVQETDDVQLIQIVSSCAGVLSMLLCVGIWILPVLRRLEDELALATPLVFQRLVCAS